LGRLGCSAYKDTGERRGKPAFLGKMGEFSYVYGHDESVYLDLVFGESVNEYGGLECGG
jgi:hypothetical protein